jgi:hypothetical protein
MEMMGRLATADWSGMAESGLTRYLWEIRRFPMLEPLEEYMLAKRWRVNAAASAISGQRDLALPRRSSQLRAATAGCFLATWRRRVAMRIRIGGIPGRMLTHQPIATKRVKMIDQNSFRFLSAIFPSQISDRYLRHTLASHGCCSRGNPAGRK